MIRAAAALYHSRVPVFHRGTRTEHGSPEPLTKRSPLPPDALPGVQVPGTREPARRVGARVAYAPLRGACDTGEWAP